MSAIDDELQNWFDLLEEMQKAAKKINSDTKNDLGDFSQQEVAKLLPTDLAKQTFQQQMSADLTVSDDDLSNSKTFTDLLETAHNHLTSFVLGVFQSIAGDLGSPKAFAARLTNAVYTTDAIRQGLISSLKADMRRQWFPGRTGGKLAVLGSQLVDPENKVSDSVTFVSTVDPRSMAKGKSKR
jgi:hypothetical protein